jgi:VWA domain-containing protein
MTMLNLRIDVLLLAATSVLCPSMAAQSTDSCPLPHILVNVVDKQGKIVLGLPPESFQLSAGDGAVTVKSAQGGTGHRVVLLVDVSGSISKSEHTWQLARVLAGNLLVAGPSSARVALVLFSDHIIDTIGFDQLTSEIVERLAKMENGKGRTAILDSIDYSIKLLQPAEVGDVIYIISDGGENASKVHRSDIETKLLGQGIRLFAFILQPKTPFVTPEEATGPTLLLELTRLTGGAIVDEDSVAALDARPQLSALLHRGYDEMAHFYNLQLSIPDRWAKKERLRLEILDEDGKKRKDVSVFYPQYLLPCTH